MYRLRFPITGAEDDPKPVETVSKADYEALQAELRQAESVRKKVEGMLLDPSYVEFVTQGGSRRGAPDGGRKPDPAPDPEIDVDALDNRGLMKHILAEVHRTLAEAEQRVRGAVEPLAQDQIVQRSTQLIHETAARRADFWDYRPTLEKIAQVYPNMHPEHAYITGKVLQNPDLLQHVYDYRPPAKESRAEREEPEIRTDGARRATSSEAPTTRERRERLPARVTAADALRVAWKRHVGNRDTV